MATRSSLLRKPGARLVAVVALMVPVGGAAQPLPTTPLGCPTPKLGCWQQLPNPLVTSVNMIALKNGKVMVHHRAFGQAINQQYQIFDPSTNSFGPLQQSPVPHNMYCAGFDQLADGRVLFAGGLGGVDLKRATVYDSDLDSWTAQQDMAASRFYPTVITLNHDALLALDGSGSPQADTPELFVWKPGTWTPLFRAAYGAPPYDFDLQPYAWTHVISPGTAITYGSQFSFASEFTRILDPVFQTWSQPFPAADAITGRSAVMYERDTLMKAGPTQTWTLAAATPGAVWTQHASLNLSRTYFFLTALADGTVFASGGVTTPEIYDPANDTWTTKKPAAEARGDHSSTVLLQDGRVLTAGPTLTAEVYSPPYLFNADGGLARRPRITGVSQNGVINYGQTFKLASPQAALVDSIRLVRLGKSTHSWDMGQRSLALAFTPACCDPALEPGVNGNPICIEGHTCCGSGSWTCNQPDTSPSCGAVAVCDVLAVHAPQHAYQAPPGYYYLFIVVNNVPSIAAIVKLE
jgi:galactose oxidase-like protein